MRHAKWIVAAALTLAGATARAEGVAAGLKIGTLGPGVEVVGYLNEYLNLRLAGNYLNWSFEGDAGDVTYDTDLHFGTAAGLLDLHPFKNGFRITGGFIFNENEFKMDGQVDDETEIGDMTFTPEQIGTLSGTAEFPDKWAPYLGLGFGTAVQDDTTFSFSFDIGVMFQGSADVSLSSSGGTLSDNAIFLHELAKEEEEAQDIADDFKIYPVLSFGICYYFW